MGLFQEYVDSKGKMRKAKVDVSGGDPDPKTPPNKPPKENGTKPYTASDGKRPKNKCEKGLGDKGDKDLQFKFKGHEKGKGPAKIPTCEQVELAVFAAEVAKTDVDFVETLVKEMKKAGMLGELVAETLNHKATFNFLSEIMEHETYGPEICGRLNRAIKAEEVAPPFTNPST